MGLEERRSRAKPCEEFRDPFCALSVILLDSQCKAWYPWGLLLHTPVTVRAQVGLVLFSRCDSPSAVRRRAQQLTVLECALLFYRALITTPVWFQYFEDTHVGGILTSSCTGES